MDGCIIRSLIVGSSGMNMRNLGIILILILSLVLSPSAWAQSETSFTDAQKQEIKELVDQAFNATNSGSFAQAEKLWSQLINKFPDNPALLSNRGNARVSQNKLDEAIADYNKSIELAPLVSDAYLNRGAVEEAKGLWDEAIADYNRVLELNPKDAVAYNNRGNAKAGLHKWNEAIADYQKAAELEPNFAFARVNYALALYEIGEIDKSLTTLRNLIRKYPQFADVRAALTAILWKQGKQGEAESNWVATMGLDNRYKDLSWVKNTRRWPPSMVIALSSFLNL